MAIIRDNALEKIQTVKTMTIRNVVLILTHQKFVAGAFDIQIELGRTLFMLEYLVGKAKKNA